MTKPQAICEHCGWAFVYPGGNPCKKALCPKCGRLTPVPRVSPKNVLCFVFCGIALVLLAFVWSVRPLDLQWPDRRPIGALFLASNFHSSATNPRGWFNNRDLDVVSPGGPQRFHNALSAYADQCIGVLKKAGAQGVIIWDIEGEQYPHKITYVGDPRLLPRLAPEMDPVADEFIQRLRDAGLRIGVTIRPQQLIFDEHGQPHQRDVIDIKQLLLKKIDYARARWGATIFYVDSNDGFWRPDELWQLRQIAKDRPDILLIPEHHYLFYRAFCVPYVALRDSALPAKSLWKQKLFPSSFQLLNIADATNSPASLAPFVKRGDVLLFRAWYWNTDCDLLKNLENQR